MRKTKRGAGEFDVALGAKLKQIRQDMKMSQVQLGQALGVSYQQVQKYETGLNALSVSMFLRYVELLGLPASAFLNDEITHSERAVLQAYREITSPELAGTILELMRKMKS